MDRPNVLIFCVDEMRADHLACAGNPIVRTPNLDRLAARGTHFPRAYCNNPICMPARATMFTGLLPRDHGLRINGQALRTDLPTLPGVLAEAGYRTHSVGKLHLTPWCPEPDPDHPERHPESLDHWLSGRLTEFPQSYYGFQGVDFVGGHVSFSYGPWWNELQAAGVSRDLLTPQGALEPQTGAPSTWKLGLPEEQHYNRWIADATIRQLAESRDSGQPFFTWCSFPDPHLPCAPPAPYCHMYDPADIPLPAWRDGELADLPPFYRRVLNGELRPNGVNSAGVTDDHWREIIAMTYGMITHVDTEIGRILDALEANGQIDNTVLVFVSDHGDMMGDHRLLWKSFYTFRGCVNVPLIVAAPGQAGGAVSQSLVSHVDLMPTILDLCGLPMPGDDWTEQKTTYSRGAVVPLSTYPGRSYSSILADSAARVRDEVVIENDDPTCGFRVRSIVTETHRLSVYPGTPDGELFDLHHDPDELHNLWYQPAHAALRQDLTARLLDAYARETPLYPIPPGNA